MNSRICLFLLFVATLGDNTVLDKTSIGNAGQLIIDFAESTDSEIEPLTENSKVLDPSKSVLTTEDLQSDNLVSEDPTLVESDIQSIILNQSLGDESGHRKLVNEGGEAKTDGAKDEDDQAEKVVIELEKGKPNIAVIDKDPIEHGTAAIISYCKGKCKKDAKETTVENAVHTGINCLTLNTKMRFAYNIAGTNTITPIFTKADSIDFSGPNYCFYWWTNLYERKGTKYAHVSFTQITNPDVEQDFIFVNIRSKSKLVVAKNGQNLNNYFFVLNLSASTRTADGNIEDTKKYQFTSTSPEFKNLNNSTSKSVLTCKRKSYFEANYKFDETKYSFNFGDILNLVVPAKTKAMKIDCQKGEFTDPLDPKLFEKNHLI